MNSVSITPAMSGAIASMLAQAARTAVGSLATTATPPTSDLWAMPLETIFTTTRLPGNDATSSSVGSAPTAITSCLGVAAMPAAASSR